MPSLSNDLRNLLNNSNFSDIVIIVQGKKKRFFFFLRVFIEQKIFAHKCILSRCKKFEDMVKNVEEIVISSYKYNVFLSLVEFIV